MVTEVAKTFDGSGAHETLSEFRYKKAPSENSDGALFFLVVNGSLGTIKLYRLPVAGKPNITAVQDEAVIGIHFAGRGQ